MCSKLDSKARKFEIKTKFNNVSHFSPINHQKFNLEQSTSPNYKSSQNLQALISPKKGESKPKEFLIQIKIEENSCSLPRISKNSYESKETKSCKLRPIDYSKNSNKKIFTSEDKDAESFKLQPLDIGKNSSSIFGNSKTHFSVGSQLKIPIPKDDSVKEESREVDLEKLKKKVLIKKPPLGAFKSPNHKQNMPREYTGSFMDLNRLQNNGSNLMSDSKEIGSWDNLNCSIEEIRGADGSWSKSQHFSQQGKIKKLCT